MFNYTRTSRIRYAGEEVMLSELTSESASPRWRRISSRLGVLLLIGIPVICWAITLQGESSISPAEQAELETYINYFGRAGIFVREYCYFDEEGNPKNKGSCKAEIPRSPGYAAGGSEYARQFRGTPLGRVQANPRMDIIYLHSFPEVWLACNNPRAFGCTLMDDWPEKVTIFLTTYDKKLNDITLTHEIEYHAKRNIRH